MTFQPRFQVIGFYAAAWLFVIALYICGVAMWFIVLGVLIQLVNTVSMTLIPVRVSLEAGRVACYFPLRATTKRFDMAETVFTVHCNPIRIASHSDILVLLSRDSKVVIWRGGVKGFDRLHDELRAAKS